MKHGVKRIIDGTRAEGPFQYTGGSSLTGPNCIRSERRPGSGRTRRGVITCSGCERYAYSRRCPSRAISASFSCALGYPSENLPYVEEAVRLVNSTERPEASVYPKSQSGGSVRV